jgi:hypothetical protein
MHKHFLQSKRFTADLLSYAMGKQRAAIRSSGSSHATANISIAAKAIRRQTDAASTTAVIEIIAGSVLMMQMSPAFIYEANYKVGSPMRLL